MFTIAIIGSTVRDKRDGARALLFAKKIVEAEGWKALLIDPTEFDFPMLHKMYKQMEQPAEMFVKAHAMLAEADGYLLVTAEYNHGIPPALKNILDHYREEYFMKPSGIISYSSGPFGGIRAAEQLRLVCAELRTPAIPISLPISKSHESLLEDGSSVNGDYERRSKPFIREFAWYLEAFKTQRLKNSPYA